MQKEPKKQSSNQPDSVVEEIGCRVQVKTQFVPGACLCYELYSFFLCLVYEYNTELMLTVTDRMLLNYLHSDIVEFTVLSNCS